MLLCVTIYLYGHFFFTFVHVKMTLHPLIALYFSTGLFNLKSRHVLLSNVQPYIAPPHSNYSGKAKTYEPYDRDISIFSSFLVNRSTYNSFIHYYSSKCLNFAFLGVSQSVCISLIHPKAFLYTFPSFVKVQNIVPTYG